MKGKTRTKSRSQEPDDWDGQDPDAGSVPKTYLDAVKKRLSTF